MSGKSKKADQAPLAAETTPLSQEQEIEKVIETEAEKLGVPTFVTRAVENSVAQLTPRMHLCSLTLLAVFITAAQLLIQVYVHSK